MTQTIDFIGGVVRTICRQGARCKNFAATLFVMIIGITLMSFTSVNSVQEVAQKTIDQMIVQIIKDIDLSRNAGAILNHYELKQNNFENNSWTSNSNVSIINVKDEDDKYLTLDASLENVWIDNQFNAEAMAPNEYVINLRLGYGDEAFKWYEAIYAALAQQLAKGEKVDFEYNGMDILCYYDETGFKITVGKNLQPINYDEMEELGL